MYYVLGNGPRTFSKRTENHDFISVDVFYKISFATPYQDTLPWWNQTTDKQLQKLVQQAIADAPDSKIAFERAQQSYALAQQGRIGFLPSVSLGWSSNTQPQKLWVLVLACLL